MKNITIFWLNSYSIFNPRNKKAPIWWWEVDIYNISTFLASEWYKVSVIVWDFWQKNTEYINWVQLIKSIKSWNSWILKGVWNIIKIFFLLAKLNPNILFFKTAWHYLAIGVFYSKLFRKNTIFRTAHDQDCNWDFIKNNWIFWKLYRYWLLNTNKIITQNIENQIMLKENHKINSEIIHNFYKIEKNIIKEYNKRNYILWVARCETWKRPELFIDLVEKNPDKNFLMISPRKKWKEDLFNLIKDKANKLNNLEFIEKVPFNEIQEYYNNVLCFVWTSDYEWFPNTYIQSCLWWTPILSLRVNPSEFITKNNLWYVCNWDMEEMNNKLNEIIKQGLWNKFSSNAINYVYKNHSRDIEWQKLINIIEKL